MANIQLIETCLIAEYFICAIEYGDTTELDDDEEDMLNTWLDSYPYCTFVYSAAAEFTRCEITGLMADCVEVKIYKNQS